MIRPGRSRWGQRYIEIKCRLSPNVCYAEVMNILIENADNQQYLTGDHLWTKVLADGQHFSKTGTAFEAAKKSAIGKFNIVGYIQETRQFINLDHGHGRGPTEAVPA